MTDPGVRFWAAVMVLLALLVWNGVKSGVAYGREDEGLLIPVEQPTADQEASSAVGGQEGGPGAEVEPALQAVEAPSLPASPSRPLSKVDPALIPVLDALSEIGWDWVRQLLAEKGTALEYQEMAPAYRAYFYPPENRIAVNRSLDGADHRVLAAVVAHEAAHVRDYAADPLAFATKSGCLATETHAMEEEMVVWRAFFGPGGHPQPSSPVESWLNTGLREYSSSGRGFYNWVLQTYTPSCSKVDRRR